MTNTTTATQHPNRTPDRGTTSKNNCDTHLCIPIRWAGAPPAAAPGGAECPTC
jgi:hypothetical protein